MTTARDLMTPRPRCIGVNDSLRIAASVMADLDVGALPICGEDGKLKGMLTDRDIVVGAIALGMDPETTPASALAKGKPVTVNSGRINWWGRSPDWTDTLGFRGEHDVEKPVGEWNTLEVTVDGGKIDTFLNGIRVNASIDANPKSGQIQIQSEGAEVFYRNIRMLPIREIPLKGMRNEE